MKTQIENFKVIGKVYAWTYKDNQRNYPGWNLTVDLKASENLSELLDLMYSCIWSSKKTFAIELPTEFQLNAPNNQNGIAKWRTKPYLTLNCKKTESENHWLIVEKNNEIEIQFGKEKLTELQNAIKGIPKGIEDFAISSHEEENIIYFWKNLEK